MRIVGPEPGPLGLLKKIGSYLNEKVVAPVYETEINDRGDPLADHTTPL
jgi:hypothetical protein